MPLEAPQGGRLDGWRHDSTIPWAVGEAGQCLSVGAGRSRAVRATAACPGVPCCTPAPSSEGPGFLVRLPGKTRPRLVEQSRLLPPDASVQELGPGRGRGGGLRGEGRQGVQGGHQGPSSSSPLCSGPRPRVASPFSTCPSFSSAWLSRGLHCPSAALLACCSHSLLPSVTLPWPWPPRTKYRDLAGLTPQVCFLQF